MIDDALSPMMHYQNGEDKVKEEAMIGQDEKKRNGVDVVVKGTSKWNVLCIIMKKRMIIIGGTQLMMKNVPRVQVSEASKATCDYLYQYK